MCTVRYILTIVVVKTDVVAGVQKRLDSWHFSIKYLKKQGSVDATHARSGLTTHFIFVGAV